MRPGLETMSALMAVAVVVVARSTPAAPPPQLVGPQARAGPALRLRGGQGSPPGGGEAAVDASAGGLQIPKPHDVGAPKSHARRDLLLRIQLAAQHRWEEEKVFEADADADADAADKGSGAKKSKYFVTFPYPYMNGLLHLGHAFSLTKAEFAVAFQRMQGKRCLWPFAFHCTGMPIQAAADTLRRELAAAGEVPDTDAGLAGDLAAVSLGRGEPTAPLTAHAGASAADAGGALEGAGAGGRYQSGKSKVAAKKGNAKTQAEVLRAMGVAEEDIGAFARADKWLDYFPQLAREDLRAMGLKIDWRRTFITTEASPWYDAFVRWQFRKLKALQKVKFGKRFSIFSPLDNQICADHDRASGEGVGAQEYTLIRMELVTLPPALEMLAGKTVVLLAATLRPETMYGQTNCWVLPHDSAGEDVYYGCFRTHRDDEIAIMARHGAQNLAYQGLSPGFGRVEEVCRVRGRDLLGLTVRAPLSHTGLVRTLPLLTISLAKGTGIVTSVPSDAPDDLAALRDLQNKPALRDKYGVAHDWVRDLAPVEIIESLYKPDNASVAPFVTRSVFLGDMCAPIT